MTNFISWPNNKLNGHKEVKNTVFLANLTKSESKKMTTKNNIPNSVCNDLEDDLDVVLYGYDLFFENSNESQLNEICNSLGRRATFNVEEGMVNYELRNQQIHKLNGMSEALDIVHSLGEHLAEKHGATFISACLNSGCLNTSAA